MQTKEILKKYNVRFSADDYRNFLIGDHYDPLMTKIDYHSVTTNISDFILGFDVEFRNGTNISQTMKNVAWKPLYYTSSWISWSRILKCFGLELKEFRNTEVYFVRLFVNFCELRFHRQPPSSSVTFTGEDWPSGR